MIFLLQSTSLVSMITVMDITGVVRVIAARSFAFYELFITAALFYLGLVYGVLFLFRKIEFRLTRHRRDRITTVPKVPSGSVGLN